MDSKIILKLRQLLGLSKKYTDEKVAETKQYVDQKFAALPVPEVPAIPVEDIAAQVVAMLPKPKKLKAKKKQIKINTVSPEDVMAMISASLQDINTEYQKTGDTIIINEAPQRVIEHIKEVVKETGGEVDYALIFQELEKQVHRMRETMPVGLANSIRGLIDVDLTNVPQDARGNYLLGQNSGSSDSTKDISTTYTILDDDNTINCTANTFTVTLPVGVLGKIYNIKNSGSGIITINTTGGATIDEYASGEVTLDQYANIQLQSDGTNWIIL